METGVVNLSNLLKSADLPNLLLHLQAVSYTRVQPFVMSQGDTPNLFFFILLHIAGFSFPVILVALPHFGKECCRKGTALLLKAALTATTLLHNATHTKQSCSDAS